MDKFIVNRPTWRRGKNDSWLLTNTTKPPSRCCLGFLAKASGYTDTELLNTPTLRQLVNETRRIKGIIAKLVSHNLITRRIMKINDSNMINDTEREAELTRLFSKLDIEVSFKG